MSRPFLIYLLFTVASLTVITGCSDRARNGPGETGEVVRLESPPLGQLPPGVTPLAYRLTLEMDPEANTYSGMNEIDVRLDAPHARIWLHSLGPEIVSAKAVFADGMAVAASATVEPETHGVTRLDFDSPVPAGAATLVLEFTASYNRNLAGIYRADQNGKAYLASQMQPIDARRAFPSFDEPRFKTPWSVSITAPEGDETVTNAALKSRERIGNGMIRNIFETTRPLQTYLIAFAIGPYDRVDGQPIPANALRAEAIPFRGFAPEGKGDKLQFAMEATDALLTIQENYFGTPYPYGKLDIIAAPDFSAGAMENAGAIIYREAALLVDERTSLDRKRFILYIHAHELAHQWFGNLVTPAWWDDIWLNEAFASWFGYKTMHAYDPGGGWSRAPTRAALRAMATDSLASARQIRNPINSPADIDDAFDAITYSKGAGVLSMFETYLGEEGFREGIRIHMSRHADDIADVNDFMASLADGSGRPEAVEAFKSFIFQPGIPSLEVDVSCSASDAGLVTITQGRYAPLGSEIDKSASQWQIPFAMRLSGPAGTRMVRQLLTERVTEIPLDGDCPDWVLPNADGAGYWRFVTGSDNWAGLHGAYGRLSPGEQLVYADSLTASFEAGAISAGDMLAGIEATTAGTWDAVQQPLARLKYFFDILPEADKPAMSAWIRRTYRPVYDRIVNLQATADLSPGDQLLRNSLYGLLADTGRDPSLRADLLGRAGRYVGINLDPDPAVLEPGQLGVAISVAARDSGQAFFDSALHYALASDNQSERSTILAALARNSGPDQLAILLKEANGSQFSGREMHATFQNALQNDLARDKAWTLFQQSWMNLVARVPASRTADLAGAVGAFCDSGKAESATAFFSQNSEDIPGYERSLAQGVERANLCVALKQAKAAELAEALR